MLRLWNSIFAKSASNPAAPKKTSRKASSEPDTVTPPLAKKVKRDEKDVSLTPASSTQVSTHVSTQVSTQMQLIDAKTANLSRSLFDIKQTLMNLEEASYAAARSRKWEEFAKLELEISCLPRIPFPRWIRAQVNLVDAFDRLNDVRIAQADTYVLQFLKQILPSDTIRYLRIKCDRYERFSMWDELLVFANALIGQSPHLATAHLWAGIALSRLGRWSDARAAFVDAYTYVASRKQQSELDDEMRRIADHLHVPMKDKVPFEVFLWFKRLSPAFRSYQQDVYENGITGAQLDTAVRTRTLHKLFPKMRSEVLKQILSAAWLESDRQNASASASATASASASSAPANNSVDATPE